MRRARALAALFSLVACAPDFDEPASLVTETRVLAVRAEPPEVTPGTVAVLDVVASDGADQAQWALCREPKAVLENNSVSPACVEGAVVEAAGTGAQVTVTIPKDACKLFGPDSPPGEFRPRDADASGGYYQPVRVAVAEGVAFGLVRIRCNLVNAPFDAVMAMREGYVPNVNPMLVAVESSASFDAIPAGARLTLAARWREGSAESYLLYDTVSGQVLSRPEELRVSWFATGGTFARDRTEALRGSPLSVNDWSAPEQPGPVTLWVVVRDDRGGVGVQRRDLNIVR